MRKKGFTLIELMVVIAIIAILAAIALTSYQAYIKKAKAKELITIARGCAQGVITKCIEEGNGTSITLSNVDECQVSSSALGQYFSNINAPSGTVTCGNSFTITASGTLKDGTTCSANCTYDPNNATLTCNPPTCS